MMSPQQEVIVTLGLPLVPVELSPEEERRARTYIWAIVARSGPSGRSEGEMEAEATRLWTGFLETYVSLTTGAYARTGPEAARIALGKL